MEMLIIEFGLDGLNGEKLLGLICDLKVQDKVKGKFY